MARLAVMGSGVVRGPPEAGYVPKRGLPAPPGSAHRSFGGGLENRRRTSVWRPGIAEQIIRDLRDR
jgi:hypothetical protein